MDNMHITVEWEHNSKDKVFTFTHVVKVVYAFTETENCLILHFSDRSKKVINNIHEYRIN